MRHQLHGHTPPGVRTDDQRWHARGDLAALEPRDRVALRPARRDDDGNRVGVGRHLVRRPDEVDADVEVLG